ncbi:2-succinyl-6-hydroxy-2,4-cyclohexadiene-1-carboxylate synthase [Desulfitobacterium metallireducens]|uniref:Putative 2-succinyl-6-hydroxy-2,4-cyclohexadiene-1-carboxylate synthase n=1 Tax=Desulfitobacterium metallireducens DSM 15288 TaxID=871968 RepID=W0EFR0_9FIRM|nr:2-succinyl-6-hydroxy-2,4-cyclohexadiene-1-carboxylate synthase [Desulfitobacterium metallireducens]AHF07911.1 2-succinyl-6-hydroxy-2,4-cyclohexadiene-1-carboxylate synthase [Desulfitobacterium metallireducens DSM 15288]
MLIDVENVHYSVGVRGTGQPVICIHGFAENSNTWELIQLDNCQMVLVDLIGHGNSEKPYSLEPYHLSVILHHLHELIHHLGFERYSLLGYSMGGRIALGYALAYPQEVSRLILESSSYGLCDDQERADRRKHDAWLADSIQENGIEWFNTYWSSLSLFASQIHVSPDIRQKISERRLQNEPYALANILLGTGQGIFPCLKPQVSDLSMPVLYINGEYDEKYRKIGQEFTRLSPRIKREIMLGVGHNTHIENPQGFTDIVKSFLERGPAT